MSTYDVERIAGFEALARTLRADDCRAARMMTPQRGTRMTRTMFGCDMSNFYAVASLARAASGVDARSECVRWASDAIVWC